MHRLAALLLGCVSAYTGTCRVLDPSRYSWYIKTSWRFNWHGEQPAVELDFDNDDKHQDFVINDETYLLWTFDIDFDPTVTINAIYPINQAGDA